MELLLSIVYVLVLGILAHYVGESLPRSFFIIDAFPYKPFAWEKNGRIYEKLKIRNWKKKLPDMSRIMKDMLPKRVTTKDTADNLNALIKETCVAEFTHKVLCVLSIGIYLIWKDIVGVILSAVFIFCNLPFIIIQRYNRPHLISLYKKMIAREERRRDATSDIVM